MSVMRLRGSEDSYLSPGPIWVPATGEQLSYWMGGLQHLLNHLQAQAPVGSCYKHADWFHRHFFELSLQESP